MINTRNLPFNSLWSFTFLGQLLFCPICYGQITHQGVVNRLELQEELMTCMTARFTVVQHPTSSEMRPLIRAARALVVEENDAERYFLNKGKKLQYSWYWDHGLERLELIVGPAASITTFDGSIVRRLDADKVNGSIETIETSHWLADADRITPNSLINQFGDTKLSSIIRDGSDFKALGNGEFFVKHPSDSNLAFSFKFDDEYRLKEKVIFRSFPEEAGDKRVIQRQAFSDFTQVTHDSGQSIWFPTSCMIQHICGVTRDGHEAIWQQVDCTITDLQLPKDLSDTLFSLEFPRTARVWDDVNGLGYIQGDLVSVGFGDASYSVTNLAILGAVGVSVGAAFLFRLSRRKR